MSNTRAVVCFMAAAVIGACGISGAVKAAGYHGDWYVNNNGVAVTAPKGLKFINDKEAYLLFSPENSDTSEYIRVDWSDEDCTTADGAEVRGLAWNVNGTYAQIAPGIGMVFVWLTLRPQQVTNTSSMS